MSDAIRCEACRWWNQEFPDDNCGWCELNPSIHVGGEPADLTSWAQPRTLPDEGCSRGEPKTEASSLTVSGGDLVAMVDGLPVFRAKQTEGQP